jgi:hypothetical protein
MPDVVFGDTCRREVRVDLRLVGTLSAPPDSAVLPLRLEGVGTNNRVMGGTVVLLQDSAVVAGLVTDETGQGEFRVAAGQYRLEARIVGYHLTWAKLDLRGGTTYLPIELPLSEQPLCLRS